MPSVATYETVESIFIAYYQRPGDPSGVRFWADYLDANNGNLDAIIDAFATSQESLDLYGPPPPVTDVPAIEAFINSIYQALFGRDADAAGLEFYTDGYIAGTFTQGSIALDILNGATGTDAVAVNNKIEVASTFTQMVDGRTFDDPDFGQGTSFDATYEGEADAQAAREFLATVTSNPATIPSDADIKEFIKSDIADPGDPILTAGASFILTTNIDVPPAFEGTPGDDTFSANDTTLNPGDGPQGGGGFDTLNYSASKVKGGVFEAGFTTGSIELVNITADGNVTIDASGMSDVETIVNQNSRADLTVTNGSDIVELEFSNTTVANNFTVAYQAATVAGGNDTQEVYVDGVLNPSTLTVNGIEHMVVVTGDTASSFYEIASDKLQSFEVEGTVGLWLDVLNFPGSGSVHTSNTGDFGVGALTMGGAGSITFMNDGYASVDTLTLGGPGTILLSNTGDAYLGSVTLGAGNSIIDASGLGGMMDVTLDNAAAPGRNVAVTGSGSDDFLDVTGGFDVDDTFDGAGGANDEIELDPSNFGVGDNAISNTEIADLVTGTLDSFDLAQFDTALELVAVNTSTSWTVDFLNLEADGSELISINNQEADLDGKTLSFDFDGLYFGQATLNLEIYNIDDEESVAVDLQDTDTSGNGFDDPVGTLNLGAWGEGGVLEANLDPWENLGVLGLEGDADIVITADEGTSTVYQVNGGTTTGDVTISAGVLSNSGATVVLGSGYDTVYGGDGDDTIDIDSGGGFVDGGDGDDAITASGAGSVDFTGGDGADTLTGSDDDDELVGGNGADDISGRAGNDNIVGDGGNDTLDGEEGSDWIFGGLGADEMTGGADPDTFYYDNTNQSQGAPFSDLITDFESGVDFLDLLDALLPANPSVTSMDDVRFTGNAPGFAAAQASLSGLGGVEIVFDTLNHQLYIDVDGNGVIDGAIDMIIRFDDSLTSMEGGDFGIATGNVYTAAVIGFDTDVAADSFENTTTSNADDIVNALANQLPGSTITGYGGYNVMNVTSPITVATDLGDFMASDFDRLNLPGGTTAPVIGPDQARDLDIYIGNGGSDFTTGTNLFTIPALVQTVSSGSGDDDITLSNYNDNASTHAGSDSVTVTTDFDGSVDTGDDDDDLVLLGGTTLGSNAVLMGGGQLNDEINIDGAATIDITGADEISGWGQIDYTTTGNVWLTIDQYNALLDTGNPVEDSNILGTENMVFFGAGTADLDADLDEVGMGDDSTQRLILGDDDTDIVGGGTGDTEVVSNIADLDGSYDGGGGFNIFRQNVNQNFTTSGAVTFTNFDDLTLGVDGTNGVDVTMSNTQHNVFSSITGLNYPGQVFPFIPFNGNTVTITDTFTGTTRNTVEDYVLNDNGGVNTYNVGGSDQIVTDNDTSGSSVVILGGLSSTTLNTAAGNDFVTILGGSSNITVNTNAGDDKVTAVNGGTNITINTDGNDTVSLGGTHTGLSVNTGIDNDTVVMQAGNSLSGTIDVGSGNDSLTFAAGDYHNVTFLGMGGGAGDIVNLFFDSPFTFTGSQYTNLIASTAVGAPVQINVDSNATIKIYDESDVDFSNDFGPTGTFGTLVMLDGGSVNYTAGNFGNIQTLELEGGADEVTLNNATYEAAANDDYLIVDGFAVGSDMIRLQNAGAANGAYQEITVAGTALSVGPNGVVEIASGISALIAPAGPLNTLDGGTVEGIIAGAVGSVASLGGAASFFAVLYASDGAAYIYQADVTAGGDLVPANFSVELVGQLNGVAADSMSLGNFFS